MILATATRRSAPTMIMMMMLMLKSYTKILVALCVFQSLSVLTTAFSVHGVGRTECPSHRHTATARQSTPLPGDNNSSSNKDVPVFPIGLPMQRVQGGGTIRTYQIPGWADRVQMEIRTQGRPMRCKVQLWLGPLRNVHIMDIDCQDGQLSPYRAGLKFQADGQGRVLSIQTSESQEMPVDVAVTVPSVERSAEIGAAFDQIWSASDKIKIQGAVVGSGELGAVRTFPVDSDVDAVQFMCWSRDTGKKSLKAKIEVLQGPNNKRQVYDLLCKGATQPFHAVFETPGAGWIIRIINKKSIEDGLFQAVVLPYKLAGSSATVTTQMGQLPSSGTPASAKEWWQ